MNQSELKPILCGTDFSGPARAAADVAAALATRLGAPLRLVHVSEGPRSPQAQEHLEAEARRVHEAGADVAAELVEGVADEVLVRLAQERGARLVVVSSLGRRAPARWLLGSVAERAAESAPVPTLVVRAAGPFHAWIHGDRALKVFVGTDFTANSDAALQWVRELREIGPCDVIAGYAAWTPEEASRLGALRLAEDLPGIQHVLERDIKEKVTRLLGNEGGRVVVQPGWGRADAQLVEMAVEAGADIMVVGTHQRHGLSRLMEGSVSRGILRYAPMSVACVPTPAGKRMEVPSISECTRVLVAVDLNEPHGFAAPYGYGICRPGGTVCLVHVVDPYRQPNPIFGGKTEHIDQGTRSESTLRALVPKEAAARGIETKIEIIDSRDAASALCAAAERFNADVICIGSHTRPGFRAKVFGSVSLAVLQHCRRPVLVVWPPTA